jgi:hypothetical protein
MSRPHDAPTHRHDPAVEDDAARAHPQTVVLDIGDDRGALILHTDPDLHGVEVEVSRSGQPRTGRHKQVLERRANGRPAYTAVFDNLAEGRYTFWLADEPRAHEVEVLGGQIAELDWRTGT